MSSKTARVKAYKGMVGLILVFFTNFCAEVECIFKFENKILSELVCIKISVYLSQTSKPLRLILQDTKIHDSQPRLRNRSVR